MKINRQEIVVSFELDTSIILTCGSALKKIHDKLGGRIISINVPEDAPPPLPRVVLKLEDTILNIGLERFQITVNPPSHVQDSIEKTSTFTFRRASSILSELIPFMPRYNWAGIISEVQYPEKPLKNKSAIEAATPIFDKLVKIDRNNKKLSAFQIQFGIKEDQHFITYTIDAYETRQIELLTPEQKGFHQIVIDASKFPVTDCGIKILVDINNKPNEHNQNPLDDLENIFLKQKTTIDEIPNNLNLKGLLP